MAATARRTAPESIRPTGMPATGRSRMGARREVAATAATGRHRRSGSPPRDPGARRGRSRAPPARGGARPARGPRPAGEPPRLRSTAPARRPRVASRPSGSRPSGPPARRLFEERVPRTRPRRRRTAGPPAGPTAVRALEPPTVAVGSNPARRLPRPRAASGPRTREPPGHHPVTGRAGANPNETSGPPEAPAERAAPVCLRGLDVEEGGPVGGLGGAVADDELLHHLPRGVVGELHRRRLHEVGGRPDQRPGDPPVEIGRAS